MHHHPKSALVHNEFVEQYRESIKPVIEMIEKQLFRSTWCGTKFQIHLPVSDERLKDITADVKKINPFVEDLASINRGNMNKYPELVYT